MSQPNEQAQACEQRILTVARDITAVIALDVAEYPDRELKRRFMADPSRAEAITDADLKRLRAEARELGGQLATTIPKLLAPPTPWLALADSDSDVPTGKDLALIGPVWALLGTIDQGFEKLAGRYYLPDDRDPAGYVPPRRFVQRLYLPTLVETCLRELGSLRNLRRAAAAEQEAAHKQSLSARWADAAPDE